AVVAVSGGADSVALLLALHELAAPLVVAHLDHGLRVESAADASFVQALADRVGLECVVERRDVGAYRRDRRLGVEAAAREVRHAFLRQVAAGHGASAIFLAHTADDHVETFLLRLIRGAGVAGLSGMRPKDGLLCRPMLGVWRREVEAFVRERGQEWCEDASNRDRRFLRNRVRHELLPLLESMNPGVRQVLLRTAATMADRQQEVEAEVLRRYGLGAGQIATALHGTPVTIRDARSLRFGYAAFDVPLPVPGEVPLDGIGVICARNVEMTNGTIDAEAVEGPLRVRSWRPGDRFQPLGMGGSKKLQDFFVDEHVLREERGRVPLVVDGSTIVWVAGMRVNERYKVTPATTRAIRLRFEPF
ncbi:MAG: tRNA lysidine(34) synthetase TilS, partial [Chloroflexi bacterium]|nr:tRNA lysidine(34) synthetase TilS [Chloroflexota bacterium]